MKNNFFKIFGLWFFVLIAIDVKADCGCEDQALLDVSYIGVGSQMETRSILSGYWWPIEYNENAYAYNDPAENQRIKNLSQEAQLMLRLNPVNKLQQRDFKWGGFTVANVYQTPSIQTKLGGKLTFEFLTYSHRLTSKDIKSIVKIHGLTVGCDAWPRHVEKSMVDLLLNAVPNKVKKYMDAGGFEHYKLGYELENEYLNFEFRHNYEGGCS